MNLSEQPWCSMMAISSAYLIIAKLFMNCCPCATSFETAKNVIVLFSSLNMHVNGVMILLLGMFCKYRLENDDPIV